MNGIAKAELNDGGGGVLRADRRADRSERVGAAAPAAAAAGGGAAVSAGRQRRRQPDSDQPAFRSPSVINNYLSTGRHEVPEHETEECEVDGSSVDEHELRVGERRSRLPAGKQAGAELRRSAITAHRRRRVGERGVDPAVAKPTSVTVSS